MLLYCDSSKVISRHETYVEPSLYGEGVRVIPVPHATQLARIGPPRTQRMADPRPFAIPEPTPELLVAYAAQKRWQESQKGVAVSGTKVSTDDAAQARIHHLKVAFDASVLSSASFKAADGSFSKVDQAKVDAIHAAVVAHVQACYAAEEAAVEAIASGAATTYDQVDAFFAPAPAPTPPPTQGTRDVGKSRAKPRDRAPGG